MSGSSSRPRVEALKVYLETQLGRISGKSTLATAIRYALNHWDGLCVFLSDGRVEIDTNTIERLHRIVATGRRNALFAGSDAGARSWAIFTSLIQSARLNSLDPFAYLKDVLEQIVSGRVKNQELDRLYSRQSRKLYPCRHTRRLDLQPTERPGRSWETPGIPRSKAAQTLRFRPSSALVPPHTR